MKVLLVHPSFPIFGGAELLIIRLANYLTKHGIENSILTMSILPEIEKELINTNIIIEKKLNFPLGEIISLHNGINKNIDKFDIINLHNFPSETSMFLINKPSVWMCNEPIFALKSSIKNNIHLMVDKYIVKNYISKVIVSDKFNSERLNKTYNIKPEIINYGIDYDFFSDGVRNNSKDEFRILHVGTVQPYKNQLQSIQVIEELINNIPNIKLIIAGDIDKRYGSILKKYIEERKLQKYVVFRGHINKEKLRELYYSCNVLLHPIKTQGGWLSPFEAMCTKIPIVVSKEFTSSDIIKNNNIGIVTDSYVSCIKSIYDNPEKFNVMTNDAKMFVKNNLTWDKFCFNMVNVFKEVIT